MAADLNAPSIPMITYNLGLCPGQWQDSVGYRAYRANLIRIQDPSVDTRPTTPSLSGTCHRPLTHRDILWVTV